MTEPEHAAATPLDYAYLFLTQDGQVRGAMRTYTATVDLQATGLRARLTRRFRESTTRTETWRVDEFVLGLSPHEIHFESDSWLPDDGIRWRAGDSYFNHNPAERQGPRGHVVVRAGRGWTA